MLSFKPVALNQLNEQLRAQFPMPEDYALKEDSYAFDILKNLRQSKLPLFSLSPSELNYVYQISRLCTEEEFSELLEVFSHRITSILFYIGWIYCQIYPNDIRAISLFTLACHWMQKNRIKEYSQTLIGRTGLPWSDIYLHIIEIMHTEKLKPEEFCERYQLIPNTTFCEQLRLAYFSRCEKDELLGNEAIFAQMIMKSNLDFLRPALKNYTAKINYEEMSSLINDAISYRLANESSDASIGLSPNMLQRIRQQRFSTILEECLRHSPIKLAAYTGLAGRIRSINLLNNGFFSIDFGNYIVVESMEWPLHAYAYTPQVYAKLLENWEKKQYAPDFWPAMDEAEITTAHDVVLNLNKSAVISLNFDQFEQLYTRDLLSSSRYQ